MAPQPLVAHGAPLVELLGSPQLQYPAIHVTGTNGKTSVARMTTALLVADGPLGGHRHQPVPGAVQRADVVERRADRRRRPRPTCSLTIADVEDLLPGPARATSRSSTPPRCEWFADIAVDVAVIEVGLGGTWDATNVVDGRVAVVTNVELDHVEYLGPTPRRASPRRRPGS